jgi:hypothetical protein
MHYELDDLVVFFRRNYNFRTKIFQFESNINSNHVNFDRELADSLNKFEIEIIVKFFTILDRDYQSMRRLSVSSIPYLMRQLKRLDPLLHGEIVLWVFANRHDESAWIPNGKFQPTAG